MIAIPIILVGACINADSGSEDLPSIFPTPEAAWSVSRCGAYYENLRWHEELCRDELPADTNAYCFTLAVESNEFDEHCSGGLLLDELPPTPWAEDECFDVMQDHWGAVWHGCLLSGGACSGSYGHLVRLWIQQCRR
jgi:hypothetical protein